MKTWLTQNLWRHVIGISICLFSLFPLYLVVISSFSSSGSLQLTSFIPTEISFSNYKMLFNDPTIPYLTWVKNSLIIAGATDILISYTYKIAFGSSTQDLGLASAISLIIFILVASISLYSLKKSKVLESFA